MFVRRLSTVALGTITAVALGHGPASAHFCYVNNMTLQAMTGASNSNGFVSFHDLAFQSPTCATPASRCSPTPRGSRSIPRSTRTP